MSETTLRDALTEAIQTHSEAIEQAPVVEAQTEVQEESAEAKAERLRDEQGRFAAKPQEQAEEGTPAPTARPRPSSWKKDYEAHWARLGQDPELSQLQEYIMQREQDYAKGVSTYKSQWDQAAPIYEAMQPFMPDLQQHNINPAQWIQNLGMAHKTLAMGSPEQKVQMFAKLATDYGVPLDALVGGQQQANPQFSMLAQELNQIKNQWTQFQTAQEKAEQARLQQEIESFQSNAEHFEAVRETMAQLLGAGLASDLQSAYDKAIRLSPEISEQMQAAQAQASQAEQAKKAAAAKAKAVSTRSAAPTGSMNSGGNGKKGLREIIAEQISSADLRV